MLHERNLVVTAAPRANFTTKMPIPSSYYEGQIFHLLDEAVAQRIVIVFLSFCFWSALFLLLYSRPSSERLRKKANAFGVGIRVHRAELAQRSVAALHALLVGAASFSIVFLRTESCNLVIPKLLEPSTWPTFEVYNEDALFYICVTCGFFVADVILCVVQYEEQGLEFVIHGVAGLTGCVFCLYTGEGLLYLMLLMMFEISTPFLHMRWWLIEYGFKTSIVAVVNGLALVGAFTTFRLVIGTPVLLKMIYELHTPPEMHRHSLAMRLTFTVAPLAMIVLNAYWGWLLWRGFLQTIGVLAHKSKSKPHPPTLEPKAGELKEGEKLE